MSHSQVDPKVDCLECTKRKISRLEYEEKTFARDFEAK